MSGVNGNVIVSGYGNDNPCKGRPEANKSNPESLLRKTQNSIGGVGAGSFKFQVITELNKPTQRIRDL